MARQVLLLLGGGDIGMAAAEFATAAGERDARIALLMQGGDNWGQYVGGYAEPWRRRGACRVALIVPGADGALDLPTVEACLREATGIFIGGGDTSIYHCLYATEPIRSIIRDRYQAGVPVGGISAGALVAPEICMLPAGESYDGSRQVVPGLGLMSGCVVGVHFSERNALPDVLDVMARTRTATAWGIDEPACAVFENGRLARVLGRAVFKITMDDFQTQAHRMIECTTT